MDAIATELDHLPETSLDGQNQWPTLSDYLPEYYEQLGSQGKGMKTYFPDFDKKLDGLRGLVVIGGEPGSGKTAFALQVAFDTALDNIPVVIYSFEMPKSQLTTRLFQRIGKLPFRKIQEGFSILEHDSRFNDARQVINEAGARIMIRETKDFFVEDPATGDVSARFDFAGQIKMLNRLKDQYGAAPLVVVDSLHEVPVSDNKHTGDLKKKIDFIMLNLRNAADQTGATFLLISHQSRSGQRDKDSNGLNSFLGSASIEYTVDMALTIAIPEKTQNAEVERHLIVAKNRYGSKPRAEFEFDGGTMSFKFVEMVGLEIAESKSISTSQQASNIRKF